MRRFLYAGSGAVMLEGVVERKSFMHEALSDLMVLIWHGGTEAAVRQSARADLTRLERYLAELDARLPDDGTVRLAFACAEVDDGVSPADHGLSLQLSERIGRVLAATAERPLARLEIVSGSAEPT